MTQKWSCRDRTRAAGRDARARHATCSATAAAESTSTTPGAGDAGEQRGEQRIVRAAEHQGVDSRREQRLEVAPGDLLGHRIVEPALLDQRHEERAGREMHPSVRAQRRSARP